MASKESQESNRNRKDNLEEHIMPGSHPGEETLKRGSHESHTEFMVRYGHRESIYWGGYWTGDLLSKQ